MRILVVFLYSMAAFAQSFPSAAAIMAEAAANVEKAADARRQFVYRQMVRSSLVRANGQPSRREKREYSVFPGDKRTEKKLVSFEGEYRKGKELVRYSDPGHKYKSLDVDGDLIKELTDDLVDDKDSRDGIPHSLFPISTKDLASYKFTLVGETEIQGRPAYHIAFEPVVKSSCISIGGDDECGHKEWKGDAWIDTAELQPVRILTSLAVGVPWGIKVFLGTNVHQTGFSVTYVRVAGNIWFPAAYGTEFRLDLFWRYKRTITLSMDSSGFKRTNAESKIEYQLDQ